MEDEKIVIDPDGIDNYSDYDEDFVDAMFNFDGLEDNDEW